MQNVEKIHYFDFTAGGTHSDNCALKFIANTTKTEEM
jgi:hypothetical protein